MRHNRIGNWIAALLLICAATTAPAADCTTDAFDGARFSYCVIDLDREELRLFRADDTGAPFGSFDRLDKALEGAGLDLGVAMNGGMYHADRSPVGLYIERGQQDARLVTRAGPGNFGLLPNGVFCVDRQRAEVVESRRFAEREPTCDFATQSGPMLVIDGALHPRFIPDSDSRKIRNGVGVRSEGREVVMAISDQAVNFHHFARFFRDRLGIGNALFLDGRISKLYAPALGRNDRGTQMGPILGTVQRIQ
jgi:uncharacterized protein YigE (DUF2233 family)